MPPGPGLALAGADSSSPGLREHSLGGGPGPAQEVWTGFCVSCRGTPSAEPLSEGTFGALPTPSAAGVQALFWIWVGAARGRGRVRGEAKADPVSKGAGRTQGEEVSEVGISGVGGAGKGERLFTDGEVSGDKLNK